MKSLCILALLAYPVVAAPSPKSADQLVHRIIDWSLQPAREKGLKQSVDAKEVARHSQDFSSTCHQGGQPAQPQHKFPASRLASLGAISESSRSRRRDAAYIPWP